VGLDVANAGFPFRAGLQQFSIDAVVDLCEQTFGYEFALFLAAVRSAYEAASLPDAGEFGGHVDLLQKRFKYGLPSQDSISFFEAGFSERVVAQKIANEMFWEFAMTSAEARSLVKENAKYVEPLVKAFPSYFTAVFEAIAN
jgi:hypothetical protein